MASVSPELDPFDLGFDADDEFSTSSPDPLREGSTATGCRNHDTDPFAHLPPARPGR